MSSLLIDAGNTCLKYADINNKGQRSMTQRLDYATESGRIGQGLNALTTLLANKKSLQRIVVVHVLGSEFEDSLNMLTATMQCELHFVSSKAAVDFGVKLAYEQPAHFGADRLVALLGARQLYANQACIVADCGTAVTVDAVLSDGEHLGGVILPGLRLSGDALTQRARAKHMVRQCLDDLNVFSRNTDQAIGSGTVFGLVGALLEIKQRMQQHITQPVNTLITGGDAPLLQPWLPPKSFELQPDLIMSGLHHIAESV